MEIKTKAALRKLSIDELEDYRNGIASEIDKLRDASRAAGVIKSEKIADTPEAKAKAKIAEGRAELASLAVESSAERAGVDSG